MAVVATINITGSITDTDGNSAPFSQAFTQTAADAITVNSVTGSPLDAPAGTTRTLIVNASSSLDQTLTAALSGTLNGVAIVFTPISNPTPPAGAPAGSVTFGWTFPI